MASNRRNGIVTSDKKAEANRRNAQKSTGPRTSEGKNAVRLNALRHGLLSTEVLLPGEDGEALGELGERLGAELQPVGELENLLVDRIVAALWRLRRLGRVEAGIFAWERLEELAERAEREAKEYEAGDTEWMMEALSTTITDEKKHEGALSRARLIRSEQEDETATLGRTFARDADRANALSRYETATERQLCKALRGPERQATCHSGSMPSPPIMDVDISGIPGERGQDHLALFRGTDSRKPRPGSWA